MTTQTTFITEIVPYRIQLTSQTNENSMLNLKKSYRIDNIPKGILKTKIIDFFGIIYYFSKVYSS